MVLVVLLNLFIILPTVFNNSGAIDQAVGRGLGHNSANNIFYSFTAYKDLWSGGLVRQDSTMHDISILAWLVPIFALSVIVFARKIKSTRDKKRAIFFGALALIGVLLSKQSHDPFPNLYEWLYDNFPGFGLYRVGARFHILVLLGYLGLFAIGLKHFVINNPKVTKPFKTAILISFSIAFLWLGKPLFTTEVGNLFVPKIEPQEYKALNSFLKSKNEFFRTMWLPEASQWGHFSRTNPKISFDKVKKKELGDFYLEAKENGDDSPITPLDGKDGKMILDLSNAKYVIVPIDDDVQEEMLFGKNEKPAEYSKALANIEFLEELKIEGAGDIKIFENKNPRPYVYPASSDDIRNPILDRGKKLPKETTYSIINNAKRKIEVKNATDSFYLVLSEKFYPDWKLLIENEKISGPISAWSPFAKPDQISEGDHIQYAGFLNAWKIETKELCQEQNHCTKNEDGSFDIKFVAEFHSQRWYLLGLLISGITFLGCMLFLLNYWKKHPRKV